jgi:hypothetical protein
MSIEKTKTKLPATLVEQVSTIISALIPHHVRGYDPDIGEVLLLELEYKDTIPASGGAGSSRSPK